MASIKLLIQIIFKPKKAFQKLKERSYCEVTSLSYILTPLILILISTIIVSISAFSIVQKIQVEQLEKQLNNLQNEEKLENEGSSLVIEPTTQVEHTQPFQINDEEGLQQAIKMTKTPISLIIGTILNILGLIAGLLILSFFFYLFSSLFGAKGKFKQTFSFVLYCYTPFILKNILQAIYIGITHQIPAPGLSSLVSQNKLILSGLFSSIDIFVLWNLLLLFLGLVIIFNVSKLKSGLIILIYFLIVIGFNILNIFFLSNFKTLESGGEVVI